MEREKESNCGKNMSAIRLAKKDCAKGRRRQPKREEGIIMRNAFSGNERGKKRHRVSGNDLRIECSSEADVLTIVSKRILRK
jgi:hypothetical protein